MKDRFSEHAPQYAAFRPHYPTELYDFIFQHVAKFGLAWDAGTGNGQAAVVLASRFQKVHATDISKRQLENAATLPNISYAEEGYNISLPDHSVDLITVAQAIHWFDLPRFFAEAKRVGKPGVLIAVWGYGLLEIDKAVDPLISGFYVSVVGPYWDPERKLIDQRYAHIEFPFHEIPSPVFAMNFEWTLAELEGYLTTWSAVQKYWKEVGENPVPELMAKLQPKWGGGKRTVHFPLFLRAGQIGS